MAFSISERVQIRRWLGASSMYLQSFPALEQAITAAQATTDGGIQPDNAVEVAVRGFLANLATIEQQWLTYPVQMQALRVSELQVSAPMGMQGLFSLGRMYVGMIADCFALRPFRDVFSPKEIGAWGNAYFDPSGNQ